MFGIKRCKHQWRIISSEWIDRQVVEQYAGYACDLGGVPIRNPAKQITYKCGETTIVSRCTFCGKISTEIIKGDHSKIVKEQNA